MMYAILMKPRNEHKWNKSCKAYCNSAAAEITHCALYIEKWNHSRRSKWEYQTGQTASIITTKILKFTVILLTSITTSWRTASKRSCKKSVQKWCNCQNIYDKILFSHLKRNQWSTCEISTVPYSTVFCRLIFFHCSFLNLSLDFTSYAQYVLRN